MKPSKRLRVVHFADHWKQVVTIVDELSWTEDQDAKLDTAIKRWYDLVLRFPFGIAIKDQMSLMADVSDQLRILRDVFATKTLIKRANSLQRYVNFLDTEGILFPGDEAALYRHFCAERDMEVPRAGCSQSWKLSGLLNTFWVSLNLVQSCCPRG